MPRKTKSHHTAEKLNEATAEAARILSLDLARCSAAMCACLDAANETEDWDEHAGLVKRAIKLANATAKLGETIGQLNGQKRQTITVERKNDSGGRNDGGMERNAPCTVIVPESAPNKVAQDA